MFLHLTIMYLKFFFSFQDFRQLLDNNLGLLVKLRDLIIDWVQEGFQDFFGALDDHFLLLSGRNSSAPHDHSLIDGTQGDKVFAGLVLVLAQLSLFVEQTAIPRITEARRQLMLLFLVPLKVSIILRFLFPKSLRLPLKFCILFGRKWLLPFLVVVLEVMNMGLPLFLEKFVEFFIQLVKSFCTWYKLKVLWIIELMNDSNWYYGLIGCTIAI